MSSHEDVIKLVADQHNADNNVRNNAEITFNKLISQEPSRCGLILMQSAMDEQLPQAIRQACLLHLKQMVPRFWSIAFESFIGPPLPQDLKETIRQKLLELVATTKQAKIRSAGAYVILQIASADYPDEWPNLLVDLYNMTTKYDDETGIVGGITVLTDLFDELISEEQFWEGGVGSELINHIVQILNQESLSVQTQKSCVDLYRIILRTLQSPETFASEDRKQAVFQHVNDIVSLFSKLLDRSIHLTLQSVNSSVDVGLLSFRTSIFQSLIGLVGSFDKKITEFLKQSIARLALRDLDITSSLYERVLVSNDSFLSMVSSIDSLDASECITVLNIEIISLLSLFQYNVDLTAVEGVASRSFQDSLIRLSIIPTESLDEYESDFNTFITSISGLSTARSTRESLNEFLTEANETVARQLFQESYSRLLSDGSLSWQVKEGLLFIVEGLFSNGDSEIIDKDQSLTDLLNQLTQFLTYDFDTGNHPLLTSRIFLVLPRYFEKFSERLDVKTFGMKALGDMITFASNLNPGTSALTNLVKAAALVSFTLYNNLIEFNSITDIKQKTDIQKGIFELVSSLEGDGEEDGLPALLESLNAGISMNRKSAVNFSDKDGKGTVDLIYAIAFKDPSNLQLTIDATDALNSLLEDVSPQEYMKICERVLYYIFPIIKGALEQKKTYYSPSLYLVLELLGILINYEPDNQDIIHRVFSYVFPVVKDLLILSDDNQILQSGGEVFNNLLKKSSTAFLVYTDPVTNETGMNLTLQIVSKFLSPHISDSAAMNCGAIVLSLVNQYKDHLGMIFISQILEATAERLIIAREAVTIESLIMVFCNLVLTSPREAIDFLSDGIQLPDPVTGEFKSGLALVLPIWFDSFEITRGYEKIRQNTLALAKIYSLDDPRVKTLIVNGDVIPYNGDLIITRSMSKKMPERYTQIPAPLKIIKLLVNELNFQYQQPDPSDYLPEMVDANDEADGDNWEDLSDVGVPNFSKLQSYVDSEEEFEQENDQDGDGALKDLMISFFKECVSKNLGQFQSYYESLDEDEKKIITESIAF